MKEKVAVIYALSHPITGEVRYIGKANDANKRLKSHLRDMRSRKTPLYNWMNKIAKDGLIPSIAVIERTSNWREAEIRLIAEYRERGVKLLNVADGGDEPFCSYETRAENGRKNAAAIHNDPAKKRWWSLVQNISVDYGKCKKKGGSTTLFKKLTLSLMALADLHPESVPASWHLVRWDWELFGELNLSVIQKHLSPMIFKRLDFSGVYE